MPFINVNDSKKYVDNAYFDLSKNNIREISGYQTIKESVENIIGTFQGEVLFEPSFGCGVIFTLFRNYTPSNVEMAKESIITALTNWEPRIIILRDKVTINTDIDNHTISISISYIVKQTGQVDSYNKIIGV